MDGAPVTVARSVGRAAVLMPGLMLLARGSLAFRVVLAERVGPLSAMLDVAWNSATLAAVAVTVGCRRLRWGQAGSRALLPSRMAREAP